MLKKTRRITLIALDNKLMNFGEGGKNIMKRNIIKILMLSILFLLIYYTKSYCVESGTVRMQVIDGATTWVNISVSESYAECESLNSETSTLGAIALRAHLTTDADWSAMAIFSVSQYGGQTSNSPTWTNNNESGIKSIGGYTQTTGILNNVTKSYSYFTSLFDDSGNPKKYVKQWSTDRESNNFVGFSSTNGTYGWLEAERNFSNNSSRPASIKSGLFGILFADFAYNGKYSNGGPTNDGSFRPVIWN